MNKGLRFFSFLPVFALGACATRMEPLNTVDHVDLQAFMGDWYVVANIPTFIERDAHNAIESYERVGEHEVATTFQFNEGAFDGPLKVYRPTGYVLDTQSNAVWGMQFIWPIKADYRVIWLNDDYSQTVIGRNKRDYVWIMARTPDIPEEDYAGIVAFIGQQGYDISKIRRVPHKHPLTAGGKP